MPIRLTNVEDLTMLQMIPFAALIVIFCASLLRGASVKRQTGDHPWAFASAKGKQRIAGLGFASSIAAIAVAGWVSAMKTPSAFSIFAAIISIVGAAIVIVAQIQMGRAWRVGVRHGDAPLFVRHGLFRFSRNPIFVGMMMIGLSVALSASLWWAWAAWLTCLAACYAQVQIEEAHLIESFGDAYRAFRESVPRWVGFGA